MESDRLWTTRGWWRSQRALVCFWWRAAVYHSAGLFLTIVLGGWSLILGVLSVLPKDDESPDAVVVSLVLALSAFVVVLLVGFLTALRTMPAELYARALVVGQREDQVLLLLARTIEPLCRRFSRRAAGDDPPTREGTSPAAETGGEPSQPLDMEVRKAFGLRADGSLIADFHPTLRHLDTKRLAHRIKRRRRGIVRLLRRSHQRLQRLEAAKLALGVALDVHPRRVCDHILQFSPAIFAEATRKLVDEWGEIGECVRAGWCSEEIRLRVGLLLRQIAASQTDCESRARYQRQLVSFADLLEQVCRFASSRSTSGSTKEYARAVTRTAVRALHRTRRRWVPRARRRDAGHWAFKALRFLHRKQRAHAGFDLHTLLYQAVEETRQRATTVAEDAADPLTSVDRLDSLAKALKTIGSRDTTSQASEDRGVDQRSGRGRRSADKQLRAPVQPALDAINPGESQSFDEEQLGALASAHGVFFSLITRSRRRIVERVAALVAACPPPLFLVTSGYSKTVREVLARRELPDGVQVYLLLTTPEQQLATRILKSELKHGVPPALAASRRLMAAGTPEMLLAMIGPSHRVLVLVGAECFDGAGRVAHPRGIAAPLLRLVDQLASRRVPHLVLAVAECYKKLQRELSDSEFYTDHMDGVDVYPAGMVHLVVGEDEPSEVTCRQVLRARLRLPRRVWRPAGRPALTPAG